MILGVLLIGLVGAIPAQEGSDPVLDAVESIAQAAAGLIPPATRVLSAEVASDGITVGVGTVNYDNQVPSVAPFLQSVIEDEVLNATATSRSGPRWVVVRDGDPDVSVLVQGVSGSSRALFTIQMVSQQDELLASTRRSFDWVPALAQAFAAISSPGAG